MLAYSRKWVHLLRSQIPLPMFWHSQQCSSGLLHAKHVLAFCPPETQPLLRYHSGNSPMPATWINTERRKHSESASVFTRCLILSASFSFCKNLGCFTMRQYPL